MVVVYDETTSALYRARPNHYVSETAGLIHVIRSTDLVDVCRTLITLSEIASYLEFRANIVRLNNLLSERAIVGQFMRGASNEFPDERNAEEFSRFRRDRSRFDIRRFLKELPELIHTNHNGDERSYYSILKEHVLLTDSSWNRLVFASAWLIRACGDARTSGRSSWPRNEEPASSGSQYPTATLESDLSSCRTCSC